MRGCVGAMYRPFFMSPLGSKSECSAWICEKNGKKIETYSNYMNEKHRFNSLSCN